MSRASVGEVRGEKVRRDGPAGNERLTAMTGAELLVLLAVEVVTTLLSVVLGRPDPRWPAGPEPDG